MIDNTILFNTQSNPIEITDTNTEDTSDLDNLRIIAEAEKLHQEMILFISSSFSTADNNIKQ